MAVSPRAPRSRRGGRTIGVDAPLPRDRDAAPWPFETLTARNPSPYTLGGTNTYILPGAGRTAVAIDPGPDDDAHVASLLERAAASGRRVSVILLTHGHSDHRGAADALARATGARVRGWSTSEAPLRDGEVLGLDAGHLQTVYTPGHAPDHVAFYWDEHAILFSGDLVLGKGTVNVTPPGGSMTAYLRSLERVRRLRLSLIAPGHGPLIRHADDRIAEYLAHRRRRERQVLALLAAGPQSVPELTVAIYPDLDPRLKRGAEGTVTAHLEKLIEDGRVRRNGGLFALA